MAQQKVLAITKIVGKPKKRGLGKEIVKLIIDDVDKLWAIGRNVSKMESLKAELGPQGEKIVPIQMDLSDTKSYKTLSDKLAKEPQAEIRWLVNNAGAGRFGASKDFSIDEISISVTTHCAAIASICNICIPFIKKGDIIMNVASQSAFLPLPYINLYASTKAFVFNYTRALKSELKSSGIKVTAVCPGWIKTDLIVDSLNGHKVDYLFIDTAPHVAKKAVRDARKGKAISINSFPIACMTWLQRYLPLNASIGVWLNMVKNYVPVTK